MALDNTTKLYTFGNTDQSPAPIRGINAMLSILQLITSVVMLLFAVAGVIVLLKTVQILNKLDRKLDRWNPEEMKDSHNYRKEG